jgi:hypothetical protein
MFTQEFFDKQSAILRSEQDGLQRKIQDVQKATPAPVDQAVDMLRLTSRASELFLQQPAAEQLRLLQVVVEKAAWQDQNEESGVLSRTRKVVCGVPSLLGDQEAWDDCYCPKRLLHTCRRICQKSALTVSCAQSKRLIP